MELGKSCSNSGFRPFLLARGTTARSAARLVRRSEASTRHLARRGRAERRRPTTPLYAHALTQPCPAQVRNGPAGVTTLPAPLMSASRSPGRIAAGPFRTSLLIRGNGTRELLKVRSRRKLSFAVAVRNDRKVPKSVAVVGVPRHTSERQLTRSAIQSMEIGDGTQSDRPLPARDLSSAAAMEARSYVTPHRADLRGCGLRRLAVGDVRRRRVRRTPVDDGSAYSVSPLAGAMSGCRGDCA